MTALAPVLAALCATLPGGQRPDSVPRSERLNGPLVRDGIGDVLSYRVSPDGAWVAYVAAHDAAGVRELYAAPSDGSAPPVKLNPPLVAGGGVESIAGISPDSQRVVYLAEQETDGTFGLFAVPLAGGAAVKLNGPLVAGGAIVASSVRVAPDSARAIWVADALVDERLELFAAPLDGGAPALRLSAGGANDDVVEAEIAPTGTSSRSSSAAGSAARSATSSRWRSTGPSRRSR